MRRIIVGIILLCASMGASAQTGALQGHAFLGGTAAKTSGMNSSNYLDGIVPSATITVYLTGTTTKATIYSDAASDRLGNPFTANALNSSNPGGWIFWAATAQGYDIVASGGISPNTYPSPVTLCADCFVGSTGGGVPGPPLNSLQFNSDSAFGGANGDWNATAANTFTLGNVTIATPTTFSCDGTNCTVNAPNVFTVGQTIQLLPNGSPGDCLTTSSGTQETRQSTIVSATSGTYEIAEVDTFGCSGVVAPGTAYSLAASDFSGLTVNGGGYGINLITEGEGIPPVGSLRQDTQAVPGDPGITLCATGPTPDCFAGDASPQEIWLEADGQINLNSPDLYAPNLSLPSAGEGCLQIAASTGQITQDGVPCGTLKLYGTTGTEQTAPHMVTGSGALSGGTLAVTLSGAAVFTSASSYVCSPDDSTGPNGIEVTYTSGTSVTFTGTGTDNIRFTCTGN